MLLPARPTIRCLQNDLLEGIEDVSQQRLALEKPDELPALHVFDHLALRKARDLFPAEGDVDAKRETISAAKGHPWWKLKTSVYRGAMHQDEATGQAWLCAVARRREGDDDDFYEEFGRGVAANGHSSYLPTDVDRRLLKRDRASFILGLWKEEVRNIAAGLLDQAVKDEQPAKATVAHPLDGRGDLLDVTVELYTLGDERSSVVEVTLTFERFDWASLPLVESAEIVCLAAVDPDEQRWRPGSARGGAQRIYSQVMESVRFEEFLRIARLTRVPGETTAGRHAHWTNDPALTRKTVMGDAVEALCGVFFVPRQDYEDREMCESCDHRYKALEPAHS